ncbi:MAG TPA: tetratricopeptide repeat protein [Candidatus Eremiobacteraceae bacterium]|nr:tetratricopeptide repeat protein [Candidatus Eremiobacteraceae bacterium]
MSIGPSFRVCLRTQLLLVLAVAWAIASSLPVRAQIPPPAAAAAAVSGAMVAGQAFDLEISVRDAHGNIIDSPAAVRLTSLILKVYQTASTQSATPARFFQVASGEYDLEVTCPGYIKARQHLSLQQGYSIMPMYIYLLPESDSSTPVGPPPLVMLAPQLRPDMERGMEELRKGHYEKAQKSFTKLLPKSHDNPDVLYNLGLTELELKHPELARSDFQRALKGDPTHELALMSLAQMELHNGSPEAAVPYLQKAVQGGVVNWRADYDLATAYLKLNRLPEAEAEASRAVRLSKNQAAPTYLLGQVQYAVGKRTDAKSTWQSLVKAYPSDPLATQASKDLGQLDFTDLPGAVSAANVATPELATVVEEHKWAPPDIDEEVLDVAPDVTCKADTVLDAALTHMKSQLLDFEKFTATEHIEHQDVDRHGWPGPTNARDYQYIVFVHPLGKDSLYVEELRNGSPNIIGFRGEFTTTALISLGVNILQPYYRDRFTYSCEGLARVRGLPAWQVHFVQKASAKDGIRSWRDSKRTWDIPLKGRIWISSVTFAVLRVETDLRGPVQDLQLTKDHLLVDYGPVDFAEGAQQLWLPWKADMYEEVHGKRFHHKHSLSNYLLFAVNYAEQISKPKEEPAPEPQ